MSWGWLLGRLIGGYARQHPLRAAVQVLAIAVGVALGCAVHLINTSALAEFAAAVRQVSGQADAAVIGPREGFADAVYERIAADPAVALASPVLEVDAPIVAPERLRGRTLHVVGVDVLRAAALAPAWIGEPAAPAGARARFALLDDGLYLSPAAFDALGVAPGDTLVVQAGDRTQALRIAGRLPAAREGHAVAAMDLGFAQWRLDRLGVLTRIDLQLAPGARPAELAARWALPAGVALQTAAEATMRASNLSRAYRVNLNVLALVALFTGAFLVYSLQAQAVLARRTQLAFLRVIGLTRAEVERLLLAEAALLGLVGALLGVIAALGIAQAALRVLGGDLGGGFFQGVAPSLAADPAALLLFVALGTAASTLGGWLPAREAARARPALALKSGSGLDQETDRQRAWPGVAVLALALALLAAPPLGGIPVAAYLAIALLLVAAILLKPLLAPLMYAPLARAARAASAPWWLATTRLAATPRFASIGAAGIVASFALMVAMATMVTSFRHSVDDWLGRVLPADLYARAGPAVGGSLGASTARFSEADQQRMAAHPAVARVEFSRNLKLLLDPARAPVSLIARPLDRADAGRQLPLTGATAPWRPGLPPPVWVSEAFAELYGARAGATVELPIGGAPHAFFVAGIWRDYARQTGAVIVDIADYELAAERAGSAERGVRTEAALWLKPGHAPAQVAAELLPQLDARSAEFAPTGEIRAISLRIFDRSFAVTYVLELVAIAIGLTGIAATFSAQAMARAREFGMLRHLGVTRGQILALLAIEGLLVTLLALLLGLVAGLAVAWVLVERVNPQSFHWTMDFRLPLGLMAGLVGALLTAATLTALAAGRRAVSGEAILAVREDW